MKLLGKTILTICLTAMTCWTFVFACQIQLDVHENISCFGETDGRLKVSTTNCKGSVSYKWSNGSTFPEITNLSAGSYTLVVSDESGATDVETFIITEPQKLEVDLSFIEPLCHGESTAQVYSSLTGGTWPYTFKWTNGSIEAHLHDVPAGTYGLTVTDDNGCTAVKSTTVTQPEEIKITPDYINHITCFGAKNGSIKVSVTYGTPPYNYSWSSGHVGPIASNLAPGNVTVTVTDYFNCMSQATFTINEPSQLKLTDVEVKNITCNGDADGRIEIKVTGGTPPYSYNWSNGGSGPLVQNLPPGTYTVEVIDDNKCTVMRSYTITQPAKLDVSTLGVTHNDCFGDENGIISVEGAGGTSPYSYDWSNSSTSSKITDLAAGTYTVTVTDDNGCEAVKSYTVDEPSILEIDLIQLVHIDCYGDKTGLIEVKAKGGVPSYSYVWSNGASGSKIEDVEAGMYWVEVRDVNDCLTRDTFDLLEPEELVLSLLNQTNVSCHGESNGSLTVGGTGGVLPYAYLWSTGSTNPTIDQLSAGTYSVTITDNNGCETNESYTVSQPDELKLNLHSSADVSCYGGSDGYLEVQATGGTAPYGFEWSNGQLGSFNGGLQIGSYTVTVTDNNGCESELTATVSQPDEIQIKLEEIVHNSCGESTNGLIEISVEGGAAPYAYQWVHGPTSKLVDQLAEGRYIVHVTDDHSCSASDTFDIFRSDSLLPAIETVENITCHNSNDGKITLKMSGGSPPYTYSWSNGSTQDHIDNLAAGIYSCLVEDANNCSYYASYEIKNPDVLFADHINTNDLTCGQDSTGEIQVAFTGGTGTTFIEWVYQPTPQDTFRLIRQTTGDNDTLSSLPSGLYIFKANDTNGCFTTDTIQLYDEGGIEVASQNVNSNRCFADSDGKIEATFSGGDNIFQVEWTYRPIGEKVFEPLVTSYNVKGDTIDGLSAGMYLATISDSSGCQSIDSFEVTQPEAVAVNSSMVNDMSCFNTNDGLIGVEFSGGTSPFAVEWTYQPEPGKAFEPLVTSYNVKGDTIANLKQGIYVAAILDENKCSGTDTFQIQQPQPISRKNLTIQAPHCHDSKNGAIEFEFEGPSSIDFVEWTYAPKLDQTFDFVEWTYGPKDTLDGLQKGFYIGHVTDVNKCEVADTVEVSGPDEIQIKTLDITQPLCHGDNNGEIGLSFTGGNRPDFVEWTYSPTPMGNYDKVGSFQGQTDILLTQVQSGYHQVKYTDEKGCNLIDTIFVDQPDQLKVDVLEIKPSSGDNGAIEIEILGGTNPYSPYWQGPNGYTSTDESIFKLEAGSYRLQVTDDNKCVLKVDSLEVPKVTSSVNVQDLGVSIYPMPFQNWLQLDLNNSEGESHLIKVVNSRGRIISEHVTNNQNLKLNFDDHLPNGQYIIMIQRGNKVDVRKAIKQ